MKNVLSVMFFVLVGSFSTYAQIMLPEDQKYVEEYAWVFQTEVLRECKVSEANTIKETEVDKCRFVHAFNMYPNPAKDVINLEFEVADKETLIIISSLEGKLLYNEKLSDFQGRYNNTIDTKNFPSGMSVLTIVQGEETFVRKLVKE